jgi:hypothetical protein
MAARLDVYVIVLLRAFPRLGLSQGLQLKPILR